MPSSKTRIVELKQKAELRVVLHNSGRYHLLLWAKLNGFDLVIGSGAKIQSNIDLRTTWHKSGSVNTHTPVGVSSRQRAKPEDFTGKELLGAVSSGGVIGWDYPLKTDTKSRRTLVVDTTSWLGGGCSAALWAVEPGRDDLVEDIVAAAGLKGIEIVGYVQSEWTKPQLVVLLQTLTPQAQATLERSSGRSFNTPTPKERLKN